MSHADASMFCFPPAPCRLRNRAMLESLVPKALLKEMDQGTHFLTASSVTGVDMSGEHAPPPPPPLRKEKGVFEVIEPQEVPLKDIVPLTRKFA